MTLEELEKEGLHLHELLSVNLKQQREIRKNDFVKQYGIDIGDTIEFMDGKDRIVGVFHRLEYIGTKPYYVWVLQLKKDGTVGNRERRCWLSNMPSLKLVKSSSTK